jgi:hypothetical protein
MAELWRWDLQPGEWWACEHPERPLDDMTLFAYGCTPCRVAWNAAIMRGEPRMANVEHSEDVCEWMAGEHEVSVHAPHGVVVGPWDENGKNINPHMAFR